MKHIWRVKVVDNLAVPRFILRLVIQTHSSDVRAAINSARSSRGWKQFSRGNGVPLVQKVAYLGTLDT